MKKKKSISKELSVSDKLSIIHNHVIAQKQQIIKLNDVLFKITGKRLDNIAPFCKNEGDNINSLLGVTLANVEHNTIKLQTIINLLNTEFND